MSDEKSNTLYFKAQEKDLELRFEHEGYVYLIRSNGRHPRAYIVLPKGHELENVGYNDINLNVHGGMTYKQQEGENYVIGWDYAHIGDYVKFNSPGLSGFINKGDRKWTVEDIKKEAEQAIEQIGRLKRFRVKEYYYSEEELDWR